MSAALQRALTSLLASGVTEGAFPAAAAWVAIDGGFRARAFAGGASADAVWDLASLTKPMVTVTLAMRGVAAGWLDLDEPVGADLGLRATVRDVLAHRSGLPAWDDLAAWLNAHAPGWRPGTDATRRRVARRLSELAAAAPPAPAATVYSDLGYILLGWHLEDRLGQRLRDLVPGFLGTARPSAAEAAPYPPTGHCPLRGRRLRGEVNDLNAWVLGGAAGHAGLFATAERVGAWALDLARAAAGRPATFDGDVVRAFWDPARRAAGETWVLGWDTPTPGASSAGARSSERSVGHLGFTGTSVWIDRARDVVVVLLTNRVDGGAEADAAIKGFRPRFHDRLADLLGR